MVRADGPHQRQRIGGAQGPEVSHAASDCACRNRRSKPRLCPRRRRHRPCRRRRRDPARHPRGSALGL
ncbi:MAG: hypothetical protein FJX11_18325 [Alphaproteobacteria bacterium]|nr:hypothetical protein [Alphaproteobacteria bacterium]